MFNTEFFFKKGKLSMILDYSAGSSGKGGVASFICEHANNWQFACNAFSAQAGHHVKLDDGRHYFYQTLNSCAYQDKYEKLYIGPNAVIELPALKRELEENNIKSSKLGIHPLASIVEDRDKAYEKGVADFEGNPTELQNNMRFGTTAHGIGAARARKILRKPDVKLVKHIPELKEFICDTTEEILARLDAGQAGILELAQGFQLSIDLIDFFPHCTSRNITVAAGLSEMMLPVTYIENVLLNGRTYPIRINSNRYYSQEEQRNLTWDEVQAGKEHTKISSPSGPGYDDQEELTWEQVTKDSGAPEQILELTSVTMLPRRVFSFSRKNIEQAIKYNQVPGETFISMNFANYIDYKISGVRGTGNELITPKVDKWVKDNLSNIDAKLIILGTGPLTDDKILIPV